MAAALATISKGQSLGRRLGEDVVGWGRWETWLVRWPGSVCRWGRCRQSLISNVRKADIIKGQGDVGGTMLDTSFHIPSDNPPSNCTLYRHADHLDFPLCPQLLGGVLRPGLWCRWRAESLASSPKGTAKVKDHSALRWSWMYRADPSSWLPRCGGLEPPFWSPMRKACCLPRWMPCHVRSRCLSSWHYRVVHEIRRRFLSDSPNMHLYDFLIRLSPQFSLNSAQVKMSEAPTP